MKVYNIIIDDSIGSDRSGYIGVTSKYIREEIAKAKSQKAKEILLVINSPGGNVYEGYAIYNILAGLDIEVNTYVNGLCASIATLIACAGKRIQSSKTSQWMFHKPSGGVEGTADEIKNTVEGLEQIEAKMAEVYAERMGKTIDKGYELMASGDKFLTPELAKELGFVNEVTLPIAAFADSKNRNDMNDKSFVAKMKSFFANAEKEIEKIIGPDAPVAGQEKLADGNSILYFEGDLTTGKAVFLNAEMTEKASAGQHALANGKIVVVDEAGVITEIREVEFEESAKLKEEIASLKAELEIIKAEKVTLAAEKVAAAAKLDKVNGVVAQLKASVESSFPKLKQTLPDAQAVQGTALSAVADMIKKDLKLD